MAQSIASPRTSLAARLAPFEALDACHQQVVEHLQVLAQLMEQLEREGVDAKARSLACAVMQFFSTTAPQHHAEEERVVFPQLITSADAETVQHVRRLQQDHGWLEEDWQELSLQLSAVADGYSWYDLDSLRGSVEVFTALYHDHIALEESLIYPQARRAVEEEHHGVGRRLAEQRRAA